MYFADFTGSDAWNIIRKTGNYKLPDFVILTVKTMLLRMTRKCGKLRRIMRLMDSVSSSPNTVWSFWRRILTSSSARKDGQWRKILVKTTRCPGNELSKVFRKAVTFVMQPYLICIGRVHAVDLSFACIATLAAKNKTIYSMEIQKVRNYKKSHFCCNSAWNNFSRKNYWVTS